MPISSATSIWVLPSKKRFVIIYFSLLFSFFIASAMLRFSAHFSSVFLLSFTWSITNMFSVPSLYIGSWSDIGSCIASKLSATSSLSAPSFFAIASIVGSLPSSFVSFSFICIALYARSLTDLLTLIGLLSLRYLRTSPDYHRYGVGAELYV